MWQRIALSSLSAEMTAIRCHIWLQVCFEITRHLSSDARNYYPEGITVNYWAACSTCTEHPGPTPTPRETEGTEQPESPQPEHTGQRPETGAVKRLCSELMNQPLTDGHTTW